MGLIRITGGISGAPEYFKEGNKQGNEFTRDELDERIVLFGDLDITSQIIETVPGTGERYYHISFSAKERDLAVDTFRQIGTDVKDMVLAAYARDEMDFYCELQLPRIKHLVNKSTGEWHERYGHLHILVPLVNLETGKKERPFGLVKNNLHFVNSLQEYINIKYNLVSPKDNPRVGISKADIIDRTKDDGKVFEKGAFKAVKADLKTQLREKVGTAELRDYAAFQEYLKGKGELKVRKPGKADEYLAFKPEGGPEFINLRDDEFRKGFFELPEIERAARLGMTNVDVKSPMFKKQDLKGYQNDLKEWRAFKSKEIRYINPNSKKLYKAYHEASAEQKLEILADLERRAQVKKEKQNDDRDRHGRDVAGDRPQRIAANDERGLDRAGARRQPDLAPVGKEPPPAARGNLRSMSERDVAGRSQRGEVLLSGDVHDELVELGSEHVREGLRRSKHQVSQVTGRTSDSVLGQLSRDNKESAAQREGDAKPTIQAIKKGLDAHRLLADLSVTHRLQPSDYLVSPAADGGARISHKDKPTSHFNVSDFLTKHMHMSWSEAQPYLAAVYERQKQNVPEPTVASPARPDMYARFMVYFRANETKFDAATKREVAELKSERWQEVRAANDEFKKAKARINAEPLWTRDEKRTEIKLLQIAKAEADGSRKEQHDLEDAEAERLRTKQERYRAWLQRGAQAGDLEALAELRAMRIEPHLKPSMLDRITGAADSKQPGTAALLDQAEQGSKQQLQYTVARNGDVTYSRAGRDLLVDAGRMVYMIDRTDQTVEQGLRLAAIKWGGKMQLTGSNEFIRQAITIAAQKDMQIEFKDLEHNKMLQDQKEKMRKGLAFLQKEIQLVKEADEAAARAKMAAEKKAPAPDQAGQAPATPTPTEQPLPYQVGYAPPPEQDQDPEQEIKPP